MDKAAITAAAERIEGYVRRTPVLHLGRILGGYDLTLKLDQFQPTGSFKVRGAFSALTTGQITDKGVAAASGGNFGLAVAHAARELGHRATIFVPDSSPPAKTLRIREMGATLEVVPGFYQQALDAAEAFVDATGAFGLHAYDDSHVMAGQGTCGLEISQQVPQVSTILVAVGGGGLIGGVASWIEDAAKVVGVESEECPTLFEARKAGRPVDVEIKPGSATSSLGASRIGAIPWQANRWIDAALLVADPDIISAQRWLWDEARIVAEPSACTTLAALRAGVFAPEPGDHVVALISGGNTSIDLG